MEKRYEVLKGLPTYDEMAVPITYNDELFVSEGFVVKFYKDDGSEWIANFQIGWSDISKVIDYDKSDYLMVIAGGIAYIMNPNITRPIKMIDYGISEVLQTPDKKLIISNETNIAILNRDGNIEWESEYIGWDGIKDLKLDGNILTGYAYNIFAYGKSDDAWMKFELNIDSKEIIGGTFSVLEVSEKKSEWKYWFIFILIVSIFQILISIKR